MEKDRAVAWLREHAGQTEDARAEALAGWVNAYGNGIRAVAMDDRRKLQWWMVFAGHVDGMPEEGSTLTKRMKLVDEEPAPEAIAALGEAAIRAAAACAGDPGEAALVGKAIWTALLLLELA